MSKQSNNQGPIPRGDLSSTEFERYTRHLQLPQIGVAGQQKLKQSTVVIIGCGGLGSPVALYLAAAGIGQIILVDGDKVELSNLQRQICFSEADLGKNKAQQTKQRVTALNSDIRVAAIEVYLTESNASEIIKQADFVVDCSDNFDVRYQINLQAKIHRKAWVYASIFQFSAQLAVFTPDETCFECLHPSAPQNIADCNTGGVLGVLPGLVGCMQSNEAIKYILQLEGSLANKLLLVETLTLRFQPIDLTQSKSCPVCNPTKNSELQSKPRSLALQQLEKQSAVCNNFSRLESVENFSLSAAEFNEKANRKNVMLLDVRNAEEHSAFNIGGQNIPLDKLADAAIEAEQILCYCQSGMRSLQAAELLNRRGIKVSSLQGGLQAWIKHHSSN